MGRFWALALIALTLAPALSPLTSASEPEVVLSTFDETRLQVRTAGYEVDLSWVGADAPVPTDVPVQGEMRLADGQTLTYSEHVRLVANGIVQRQTRAVVDQRSLPSAYVVKLADAEVLEASPARVTVRLQFAWLGLPDSNGNVSGYTQFTFLPTRVEHDYGYRFVSATAPSVLVTERFAFAQPYADRLSVDPLGIAARDHGESLDRYSTWESYAAYGMLFREPARSDTAFNLHRVRSSGFTNYLDEGWFRGDEHGVELATYFNAFDSTASVGAPLTARRGVAVVDFWHLPSAGVAPRDLARFYAEVRGGTLGDLPPMPPLVETTPFALRCPDFPLKPDGTPCERFVVAVVDSGVNPYHWWFRRPGWTTHPSEYVEGFPADVPSLDLTFSENLSYNRLVDLFEFGAVGRDRLVTVPGTNIIGAISFGEYTEGHSIPVVDEFGHGTGTAGAVTLANPDVALVIVEMGFEDLDRGLAWLANQTWIDAVSMSLGTLGDLGPVGRAADAARASPQLGTRRMAENGQLVFVASGNNAGATQATDNYDGPHWVVSVGGVSGDSRGWWLQSTRGMDVSSDPLLALPRHDDVMWLKDHLGTSFATPTVAGLVSRAVTDARIAAGHVGGIRDGAYVLLPGGGAGPLADGRLTHDEVRAAINATAVWFAPEDYRRPPQRISVANPGIRDELPFPPGAPWTLSGWGYLGPDQVAPLTDVLLGRAPPAEKPAQAHAFMTAQYELRAKLWGDAYPLWGPHMEQPIVDRNR